MRRRDFWQSVDITVAVFAAIAFTIIVAVWVVLTFGGIR